MLSYLSDPFKSKKIKWKLEEHSWGTQYPQWSQFYRWAWPRKCQTPVMWWSRAMASKKAVLHFQEEYAFLQGESFVNCKKINAPLARWVSFSGKLLKKTVIHTVKVFGVVNKAKVDIFLERSCFFYDPADIGNLISGSSAFWGNAKNGIKKSIPENT